MITLGCHAIPILSLPILCDRKLEESLIVQMTLRQRKTWIRLPFDNIVEKCVFGMKANSPNFFIKSVNINFLDVQIRRTEGCQSG